MTEEKVIAAAKVANVHGFIMEMEKGRIVERGTHAELITKEGVYKRLQDLQSFDDS